MTESKPHGSTDTPAKGSHDEPHHEKLGEFASTAICGNDITSSCLYVSALAIGAAGKLAPFGLIIVAVMLFLFRKIYAEVVGALPLNGGAYNALLNTTSKSRASIAACLTILSYMATAIISAGEAMHYGANLPFFGFMHGSVFGYEVTWWATIALLGLFTTLTIWGISESASVAIFIFVTHLATLSLLILMGVCFVMFSSQGWDTWNKNWSDELHVHEQVEVVAAPLVAVDADGVAEDAPNVVTNAEPQKKEFQYNYKRISTTVALFFGFSIALLGISGFESSANFVEEQKKGVFPKTLRNMWLCVSFFNPAMAFLALALIPIDTVQTESRYQLGLLAEMGRVAGGGKGTFFGESLAVLISIDAVLVLSGAVLTSFVGVNGLVRRLALDRCLPQFLLKLSSRGTTHRILLAFFLLCVSVNWVATKKRDNGHGENHATVNQVQEETVVDADHDVEHIAPTAALTHTVALVEDGITPTPDTSHAAASHGEHAGDEHDGPIVWTGDVDALAGVYTISFLTVMALFAVGNVLLKIKRDKLPRPVRASWFAVIVAILAVLVGLVGNATRNPDYLIMFMAYFLPAISIIGIMLYRIPLLKLILSAVKVVSAALIKPLRNAAKNVRSKIDDINSQQVVFFTRGDNVSNLNNAMQYVMENEDTNRIKVVTVVNDSSDVPPKLAKDLEFLDEAYPQIDIEYVERVGKFGPELIHDLSEEWNVPTNLMFIGSPGGKLPYGLAELGGVRLII